MVKYPIVVSSWHRTIYFCSIFRRATAHTAVAIALFYSCFFQVGSNIYRMGDGLKKHPADENCFQKRNLPAVQKKS
jgi:hypothetical protein